MKIIMMMKKTKFEEITNSKFLESYKKQEIAKLDEKIDYCLSVLERASKQGNLMTDKEYQDWRTSYNNVMNEGGEGYIPELITKEKKESTEKKLASLKMAKSNIQNGCFEN